jgi:Cell wall hydrolyses involved in spore germination
LAELANQPIIESFLLAWAKALMVLCVWREARGEPMNAKIGVAEVIRNRAARNKTTYDEEVLRPKQFSAFGEKDANAVKFPRRGAGADWRAFKECIIAVETALRGSSIVAGATHYHDTSIAPPPWAKEMECVKQIGRIRFYAERTRNTANRG